jgi:hypothetical protein
VRCVLEVAVFEQADKIQAETLGVGEIGGYASRPWGAQHAEHLPYPSLHRNVDPQFDDNYTMEHLYYVDDSRPQVEWIAQSQAKMRVTGILLRVSDDDPKLIRKAQVRKERRRFSVCSDSKSFPKTGSGQQGKIVFTTAGSPCRFSQHLLSSTAPLRLRDRRNQDIHVTI